MAKLTNAQMRAIAVDTRKQHIIARDYGVAQSRVSRIKRGIKYAISEQGTVPESWIAESSKLPSVREGLDPSAKATGKPRRKGRSLSDNGPTEPTVQDERQDPETD